MTSAETMNWVESYLPTIIYEHLQIFNNSKAGKEFMATILPVILISSVFVVYFYWNFVVIPELLQTFDFGGFCAVALRILFHGVAAYLFHGICCHYYLVIVRKSCLTQDDFVPFTIDNSQGLVDDGRQKFSDQLSCMTVFEEGGLAPPKDSDQWHPCFECHAYVCPKAFHCKECQRCVLRRDHHCSYTRTCIGLENHVNFIGFVVHISVGSTLAFLTGFLLDYQNYGLINGAWNIFKPMGFWVGIIYGSEFRPHYVLIQLTLVGILISILYLKKCIQMCSRGQTCFEVKRETYLKLASPDGSYYKFEQFLGPNAIFKILFPLYRGTTSAAASTSNDRRGFIDGFNTFKESSNQKVCVSLCTDQNTPQWL